MLAICCAVSSPPAAIFSLYCCREEEPSICGLVLNSVSGPGGAQQQPCGRDHGDSDIFGALHFDQHHGAEHQRHGGQHLVRDTEQRPGSSRRPAGRPRPDTAGSPQADAARGTDNTGHQRVGFLRNGTKLPSRSCSIKRPARVPASSAVRINSASNRIPKWYQKPISAIGMIFVEHVSDTHGQCRAARAVQYRRFADIFRGLGFAQVRSRSPRS